MAKIGLFSGSREQWVPFDQDTEFLIKFLPLSERRSIAERAEAAAARTRRNRSLVVAQQIGRVACLGWRHITKPGHPGLTCPDGTPIPFTPENLDMLMEHVSEVNNFILEACADSATYLDQDDADREQERERDQKNA